MLLTDLFGNTVEIAPVTKHPTKISTFKDLAALKLKRQRQQARKLHRYITSSNNCVLFDELLMWLRTPVLQVTMPDEYRSDCGEVPVLEDEQDAFVEQEVGPLIPYVSWGSPWFEHTYPSTCNDGVCNQLLGWSKESFSVLQVKLFWRSLEELTLNNNEHEKWSVLKWIFRPAIRKEYVFDHRIGRSHCLQWHERDETFSFHNCCMAARMDEDAIREGVRRNIPERIIQEVERVVLA